MLMSYEAYERQTLGGALKEVLHGELFMLCFWQILLCSEDAETPSMDQSVRCPYGGKSFRRSHSVSMAERETVYEFIACKRWKKERTKRSHFEYGRCSLATWPGTVGACSSREGYVSDPVLRWCRLASRVNGVFVEDAVF